MQDLKDLKRCFSYANDRGGQAPARRYARPSPFTVGRGPVPRHASIGETALVGVRFSRGLGDRGGQAPARRYARPFPLTVARGPIPRRAIEHACALHSVSQERLLLTRSGAVLPNYGLWGT